MVRGNSNPSAVCYAENKVAYVDGRGVVRRTDISVISIPLIEYSLWDTFVNAIGGLFDYQLYPSDYYKNETKTVMEYIAETKNPEYILSCLKVFDKTNGVPYHYYGGATDPVFDLIKQNDAKSLKAVLEWRPDLSDMRTTGGQFDGPDPARVAVENDYLELVRAMLPYIVDVNAVRCLGTKESGGGGMYNRTCNLLSFAKSDGMKDLLVEFGVKTLIPYTSEYERITHVNDDNVNIRSSAGLSASTLDRLKKGAELEVVGVDPYYYDIDGYHGHWIQIKYGEGKTEFIFEKYLDQWWQ